jgi:hypothetical protein
MLQSGQESITACGDSSILAASRLIEARIQSALGKAVLINKGSKLN